MIFDIFLLIDRGEEHAPVAVYFGVFVRSHVGDTAAAAVKKRQIVRGIEQPFIIYYMRVAAERQQGNRLPFIPFKVNLPLCAERTEVFVTSEQGMPSMHAL